MALHGNSRAFKCQLNGKWTPGTCENCTEKEKCMAKPNWDKFSDWMSNNWAALISIIASIFKRK